MSLDDASAAFLAGYRLALQADRDLGRLRSVLLRLDPRRRPFAVEGAAMGCRLLDPRDGGRRTGDLADTLDPRWSPFVRIGIGCALARLGLEPTIDALVRDGYGFQLGLLTGTARAPGRPDDRHAERGRGRALWFVTGGRPEACRSAIEGRPSAPALWRGVATACAFAGDPHGAAPRLLDCARGFETDVRAGAREAVELWASLEGDAPDRSLAVLEAVRRGEATTSGRGLAAFALSHAPGAPAHRAELSRAPRPPAEVDVDVSLARDLLRAQCRDLASEELTVVDEGWDNVMIRVGEAKAVRLPRREQAVALTRNEQRWLPVLGPRIDLPTPVPLFIGAPSERFPWPWSVVPWLPGGTADRAAVERGEADRLARVLRSFHATAPADAPRNPYRGVPLVERRTAVEERLDRVGAGPELRRVWQRALSAPAATERRWLHGDLHPRNILVHEGRFSAILDWGDVTGGDVATDLACAWMLFGAEERAAFLDTYGASEPQRDRAAGWAVNFATALQEYASPPHRAIGSRTVEALVGGTP